MDIWYSLMILENTAVDSIPHESVTPENYAEVREQSRTSNFRAKASEQRPLRTSGEPSHRPSFYRAVLPSCRTHKAACS